VSRPLIELASLHTHKRSMRGRHSSPKASLLTLGDTTLPRSKWAGHQGLSQPVWYARLKKYKQDGNLKALLAKPKTKAQAGAMGKSETESKGA